MRQGFEELNPNLKSWFRGEKAVFLAGIKCLINLISHDKSAHSTNLAEEFDQIVESEDQVKHIGLYKECRFTKLGYTCAALLDAMPMINILLDKTHLVNKHVEAARMYTQCDFFLTELIVIAYFSYHVTLPFLNFVEKSTQDTLLKILPKLYEDLKNNNINTLEDFRVKYSHIIVEDLTEPLQLLILENYAVMPLMLYFASVDVNMGLQEMDQVLEIAVSQTLSPCQMNSSKCCLQTTSIVRDNYLSLTGVLLLPNPETGILRQEGFEMTWCCTMQIFRWLIM